MFDYGHHLNMVSLLFFLVFAHQVADYPLQGPYLSELKNPTSDLGKNGDWKWGLFAHAMIHGGFVAIITHSVLLGVLEVITHALIDYQKCMKAISFRQDQWLHLGFKVIWAYLAASGIF